MKKELPYIPISAYDYDLPADRIADAPLPRGEARQLRFADGQISHGHFAEVVDWLRPDHLLFFNNTKVLPARLHFYKETGARIEVFLLEPVSPFKAVAAAMVVKGQAVWQCTIGNLKRWKDGQALHAAVSWRQAPMQVQARLANREKGWVELSWTPAEAPFVDVVEALGKTPLPPYIKREADESDKERYQTVYSKKEGAVAAPTAGLHFSDAILARLANKGVEMQELTLHVGAGTFQPVKTDNALAHHMHGEQVVVLRRHIEAIMQPKEVVAVGTTSMRTLESLYWYGVLLLHREPGATVPFFIQKDTPYIWEGKTLPARAQAAKAILEYMDEQGLEELHGHTEIYIFPGYAFRVCSGLITNFHMPKSTLLLLIGAFVGNEWQRIYHEAMANGYRFLSYGDSSLLFTPQKVAL